MSVSDVAFISNGIKLAGHLYLPTTSNSAPAIVVGHPGSGVKEQTAGTYARRLAERGFVALAFDAAFQGASDGEPRGLEDPSQRVEDIKAAVSFLGTRAGVDAIRIGVLGICASGGYALSAAASDHRIKAVATVSAVDISRQYRLGADGTQAPASFRACSMLRPRHARRTLPAATSQYFQLFPDTIGQARSVAGDHGADGFEYYCTPRGQHPNGRRSLPWRSIDRIATFDAFAAVEMIAPRPILMIAGTRAVTSWMTVEAFQRAAEPKRVHWIEGASHVDLYDKPEYVGPAIDEVVGFFAATAA